MWIVYVILDKLSLPELLMTQLIKHKKIFFQNIRYKILSSKNEVLHKSTPVSSNDLINTNRMHS